MVLFSVACVCVCGSVLTDGGWILIPVNRYKKRIPEFVLQTAIDVKSQFRCVELFVEELQNNPDPFLVLRLPNGKFLYLEVWNEPGFKKIREI